MMFTLDPYAARSCPLKTVYAFRPNSARPRADGARGLPGSGEFIHDVLDRIASVEGAVDLRALVTASHEEQEAACIAAMAAGAPAIVGGLLPRDWAGHRQGRPDVLVRHPDGGYAPGVAKFQRALDPRKDDLPFRYSRLTSPGTPIDGTGWRYRWHWRWPNALQLAHLWHLLGPTGFRASEPVGLIIGTDRVDSPEPVATWVPLVEATVPAAPQQHAVADGARAVTALARYDHEFANRVQLAEEAASGEERTVPHPIASHECSYCDWWRDCRPRLDDDDLSLRISKSPLDRYEIDGLRRAGVHTVADLAAADLDLLLPVYLPTVAHRDGAEDRLRVVQRRSRLLSTGSELDRLRPDPIVVPRATLEIDIDIETSRADRVYLWGFWVTGASESYYRHFSDFSDLDDDGEVALARSAMAWLRELVAGTDALVFHYSDYEIVRLNRLALVGDETLSWARSFATTGFFDLFEVVRSNFFGANGLGLKAVASAGPGFSWRDEEPGGLNSMAWFDDAVSAPDPAVREAARQRVLRYNEDDVRATAALRTWLRALD
jgi:predicted RecB family nuclease